ncbi:MAG: glycerophosphodiester phosphodiesterase family protein [Parasphingorhabdus sp.]
MKRRVLWVFGGFWLLIIGFYLFHSSIWAPARGGTVKMIANGNIYQPYDRTSLGPDDCIATRIGAKETKSIFQNTVHAIRAASEAKADMVEVDVAPTKDGKMVLFNDGDLNCRTDGKGTTSDLTLEELQKLDLGYGLTPDDGKSFPLRGEGVGKIATVEDALGSETKKPFMFHFKSDDPKEADQLLAILKAHGRDPVADGDSFYGDTAPVKRMRALVPGIWAWTAAEGFSCASDYKLAGWIGSLPESCKGGTMIVSLDQQWRIAGWPNRTAERMEEHGGHIILAAGQDENGGLIGLRDWRQLRSINGSYKGWLWVDDIATVGPALVR